MPILCNQENFILRGNAYKIKNALPDLHTIIKPAVVSSFDGAGRPKNGMFISVPGHLRNKIEDVSPTYWRVQAVIVNLHNVKILLINSYFPVDPNNNDENYDLIETLQCIRGVIGNNEHDTILWAGDINTDFNRNSKHVRDTVDFLQEHHFHSSWNTFAVDYTHYHEVNGISYVSTIDHFFWDSKLADNVTDCGVIHHHNNLSDHSPIFCKFDLDLKLEESLNSCVKPPPKPCWSRSTESEKLKYTVELNQILSNISVPEQALNCPDVHCTDPGHIRQIDAFVINVLQSVDEAASSNLCQPSSNSVKREKPVPGWSRIVQPFKDKSIFWHKVWLSAGRPVNTELHNVMKHARNVYHYQLRKYRKSENIIRRDNLLNACINGNNNIFDEIKKIRKTSSEVPTSIDGNSVDTENHFKRIYEKLYKCTDDKDNVKFLHDEINMKINYSDVRDVKKVTPKVLKEASLKLKSGKSDPTFLFSSDCFKSAPNILYDHLAAIIKSFLIHGHVSTFLLIATLVPIIKDKLGSQTSSKNYRSIAISSLVLKIFDWVTLALFGATLGLDDLQYAYQSNAFTTMCTWLVIETV